MKNGTGMQVNSSFLRIGQREGISPTHLLAYYIGGPDLFCKQESIRGTLEGIAAELTVMDFLLFMTISGPSE